MSARRLRAVSAPGATPAITDPPASLDPNRPVLMAAAQGLPVLLRPAEVDLIALVNAASQYGYLTDPAVRPGEVHPAEYLVDHVLTRYGLNGKGGGARVEAVASLARKHLIPFLVEAAWAKPETERGAAAFRLADAERLPRILAGREKLPAATVASLHLGQRRYAAACLYLDRHEAALVVDGGADRLDRAIATGGVEVFRDLRTDEEIVRPFDLRGAGILRELDRPHGIESTSATNVLRELKTAFGRANDSGAGMVGNFDAIEPLELLAHHRMRSKPADREYVSVATVRQLCQHLPLLTQVVLWLERLLGLRAGESFGPLVRDYRRDETGRGWLRVARQGGKRMLVRDPATHDLYRVDHKDGTKTPAGTREIPLPHLLAAMIETLIAVFHTDPQTGETLAEARLIPGIGKDDAAGQSTYRANLKAGQAAVDLDFDPHAMRGALITDLKEAGVKKRVRFVYAGHEDTHPDIQTRHYDQGVSDARLVKVAKLLDKLLTNELGELDTTGLIVPTTLREQWGTTTRIARWSRHVERQLLDVGWWRIATDGDKGAALDVQAAAARLGEHGSTVKRFLQSGQLPGFKAAWGSREVWRVWAADVDAFDVARGRTLRQVAEETGWTYEQLWVLTEKLGLGPANRVLGQAIRLDAADEDRLIAEIERREAAEIGTLTVAQAAERLSLDADGIDVLLDHGYLELAPGHEPGHLRRITLASVDRLTFARAERSTITEDDPTCTPLQAGRRLGIERRTVARLIAAGVLRSVASGPRGRVTVASVESHADHQRRARAGGGGNRPCTPL